MSVAVAEITHRGSLRPEVHALAELINRTGKWRVTSGYRPPGPGTVTHHHGVSIDIAPLDYYHGGYGLRTAAAVLAFVMRAAPKQRWIVIAEADHLHIQLSHHNAYGINTERGTILRVPGKTGEHKMAIDANGFGNFLPEGPVGDALAGDYDEGDALVGDADLQSLSGDALAGDARFVSALANQPMSPRVQRLMQKLDPNQRKRAVGAAQMQHINNGKTALYETVTGGTIRSNSIGGQRMGQAEIEFLRLAIMLVPYTNPTVTSFSFDGGSSTYYLDVSAFFNTLYGFTPPSSVQNPGGIVIITASQLTLIGDSPITITRNIPAVGGRAAISNSTQLQLTARPGGQVSTRFFFVNAAVVQARAQAIAPSIATDGAPAAFPIPAAHTGITITGLPTGYTITYTPFNVADTFTNEFMRGLGARLRA